METDSNASLNDTTQENKSILDGLDALFDAAETMDFNPHNSVSTMRKNAIALGALGFEVFPIHYMKERPFSGACGNVPAWIWNDGSRRRRTIRTARSNVTTSPRSIQPLNGRKQPPPTLTRSRTFGASAASKELTSPSPQGAVRRLCDRS